VFDAAADGGGLGSDPAAFASVVGLLASTGSATRFVDSVAPPPALLEAAGEESACWSAFVVEGDAATATSRGSADASATTMSEATGSASCGIEMLAPSPSRSA
jgi:hypothetical protein